MQVTDPHLLGDADGTLREVVTLTSLRRVLRAAQTTIEQSDVLLVTGDIVNDDAAGYQWLRTELGALQKPVLCIAGNHDPSQCASALNSSPFQFGGHFDLGSWRIVMLNSACPGYAYGRLSTQELERLEQALNTNPQLHILIVMHHHPVPMGSAWLDAIALQNSAEFFGIVDRHPNVCGILWGHVHQTFDAQRRQIKLMGTPSTCFQFLPHSDNFKIDTLTPAYRSLELFADGHMQSKVHWLNKIVLES